MKALLKSRTVQVVLIQAMIAILVAVLTELDLAAYVLIVKSIGDILLRLDTKEEISGIM